MAQSGGEQFDYRLQVWVSAESIVIPCGHPASMGGECCNARRFAGMTLGQAYAAHMKGGRS